MCIRDRQQGKEEAEGDFIRNIPVYQNAGIEHSVSCKRSIIYE